MTKNLDINYANIEELSRAFHDHELAQAILNKRELDGDFKDWEDLRHKVAGISDQLIADLRDAGVAIAQNRTGSRSAHRAPRKRA